MMAVPCADWNVFKQIFADHWDDFKCGSPHDDARYDDDLVEKILGYGHADKMGYIEYRCQDGGQGQHLVSMTCKSALCLRGAKVCVDDWVAQVSHMLHEGVIYRHTRRTFLPCHVTRSISIATPRGVIA